MALAAVLLAVLSPVGAEPIAPQLIFNTDVTTVFLKEGDAHVYCTKAVREYLRTHNRAITSTGKKHQARTIGIMPTFAADGTVLCTTMFIKDEKYKEPNLVQVNIF